MLTPGHITHQGQVRNLAPTSTTYKLDLNIRPYINGGAVAACSWNDIPSQGGTTVTRSCYTVRVSGYTYRTQAYGRFGLSANTSAYSPTVRA